MFYKHRGTSPSRVTSPPRRSHRAINRGTAAARPPLGPRSSRPPSDPGPPALSASHAAPGRPRAPQQPPALPPAPPRAAAASRHLSCSRRPHRASPRPFRGRSMRLRACAHPAPGAGRAPLLALRLGRELKGCGRWLEAVCAVRWGGVQLRCAFPSRIDPLLTGDNLR